MVPPAVTAVQRRLALLTDLQIIEVSQLVALVLQVLEPARVPGQLGKMHPLPFVSNFRKRNAVS